MLCTPPAFILSQDQTLEKFISYASMTRTIFSSYSFLASFTLLSIYNSSLTRSRISHFAMLCTISLVVQFSMTVPPSVGQLDYYTTITFVCQEFFWNFLKTFSKLPFAVCLPLGRLAYYTSFLGLCQGIFEKKFKKNRFSTIFTANQIFVDKFSYIWYNKA